MQSKYALLLNVVDENIAAPSGEQLPGDTRTPAEASDVACTTLNFNCTVPMLQGELPLPSHATAKAFVLLRIRDVTIGGSMRHWFFEDETHENKTAISLTFSQAVVERVFGPVEGREQLLYLGGSSPGHIARAASVAVTADVNRDGERSFRADLVLDTVACHAFVGAWLDVIRLLTPAPLLHRPLPHTLRASCDAWAASITVHRFQAALQSCCKSQVATSMFVVGVQHVVARYVRPSVSTTDGSPGCLTSVPDQHHSVLFNVESLSVALHNVPSRHLAQNADGRESMLAATIANSSQSTIVDDFAVEGKWELYVAVGIAFLCLLLC